MILPKNDTFLMNKICTINQLSIPKDLLDIIKEYIFYDASASIIIQHIRNRKVEICELIKNAINLEEITNMCVPEEWIFIIDIPHSMLHFTGSHEAISENDEYWPLSITYEFGGKNCQICGDYILPKIQTYYDYDPHGISSQNMCKCIE